jgi:uncharacterized protein
MGFGTACRPGPVGAFCAVGGSGVVSGYQPDLAHSGSGHVLDADSSGPSGDSRAFDGGVPGRHGAHHASSGGVLDASVHWRRGRPQPRATTAPIGDVFAGRVRSVGVRSVVADRPAGHRDGNLFRPGTAAFFGGPDAGSGVGGDVNMAELQGFNGSAAPAKPTPAARVALRLVRLYQSATTNRPSPCRYVPTCSSYALDAYEMHGFVRGSWLSIRRIARCHPWSSHGWDPVPDRNGQRPPDPTVVASPSDSDDSPNRRPV